jgi:hypothetical protein
VLLDPFHSYTAHVSRRVQQEQTRSIDSESSHNHQPQEKDCFCEPVRGGRKKEDEGIFRQVEIICGESLIHVLMALVFLTTRSRISWHSTCCLEESASRQAIV